MAESAVAHNATAVPPDNGIDNRSNEAWGDEFFGWAATFIAMICYGSYGVPIKESLCIDVHPFVMQSYKTITMFVTVWFVVLPPFGIVPAWTNWGLLSGLLWVVGGSCGVYAIRAAGMAVAVGTWASVMIIVNFIWGVLVFREPIKNLGSAIGAFLCLGVGVVGMSIFSSPPTKVKDVPQAPDMNKNEQEGSSAFLIENNDGKVTELIPLVEEVVQRRRGGGKGTAYAEPETDETDEYDNDDVSSSNNEKTEVVVREDHSLSMTSPVLDAANVTVAPVPRIPGLNLRASGIVGAIGNGIFAGSSLIPVHFAKAHGLGGANYLISFACGSFIANTALWIVFYLYHCFEQTRTLSSSSPERTKTSISSILFNAWKKLPSVHFRKLWLKGFVAGAILSMAMFGSIISVTYLGQAVGNSCIQSKILISGLWGIFWYREITGCATITRWFLSASIAVLGIVWLSQERRNAPTKNS